jgi:hypothetical protein
MRIATSLLAGLGVGLLLWVAPALGADKPASGGSTQSQPAASPGAANAPQMIEGQVVAVDPARSMVTVKAGDGATHQFQVAQGEIQNYKVGDHIEAKLRSAPSR